MGYTLSDAAVNTDSMASSWIRTPYGVQLSENPANSFQSFLDIEKFVMAQDGSSEETSTTVSEWMSILEDSSLGDNTTNRDGLADGDVFYTKPNYTDTRVGGNDAINPYWQFNRDDDIVPPLLAMKILRGSSSDGMGRVYSEVYDSNQQILWLSMGVPEYVNLISFYKDAGSVNAARAMNRGTVRGLVGTIIQLVFSATVWAITFPVLAPFWVCRWVSRIETNRVSKYFYFKPAMVLYYEMVNTMLSYLAVGMGLYPQVITRRRDSTKVLTTQYAQMQGEADPHQDTLEASAAIAASTFSSSGITYDANLVNVGSPETNSTPTLGSGRIANTNRSDMVNSTATTDPDATAALTNTLSGNTVTNSDGTTTKADTAGEYQQIATDEALAIQKRSAADSGIPEILQNGPDIFAIINRRARLFNSNRYKLTTRMLLNDMLTETQSTGNNRWTSPNARYVTDKDGNVTAMADPADAAKTGAWANAWDSLKSNVFGAGDYVGFRIERGVNTSESISNSTGPTSVAQKLNDYSKQQRDKFNSYGNSWVAATLGTLVEKGASTMLTEAAKELVGQLGTGFGLGDIGAIMTQGNGYLDMPDVWNGSSFSRSYSFSIQLRARYGDPVSIYQSIYIPLCMLLAAAMPRSIGDSMYTSPFLIKAYCKGMFSVPCGIIDNLSITRGKDEFGWSDGFLPTAVDVSVSIKDLSPTFFLAMQDIGLLDTFTRNDNMMEYLDTLSALGITERLFLWPKAMRKLSAAMLIKRNTIFNSNYWGVRVGRNYGARLAAAVTPFANYEKSDFDSNLPSTIFN